MKGKATTIIAALALFFSLASAGTASAAGTPRLSTHRATLALRRYAEMESASLERITACHRLGRSRIDCRMRELGVPLSWTLNGAPMVATVTGRYTVVQRTATRFLVESGPFEPQPICLPAPALWSPPRVTPLRGWGR